MWGNFLEGTFTKIWFPTTGIRDDPCHRWVVIADPVEKKIAENKNNIIVTKWFVLSSSKRMTTMNYSIGRTLHGPHKKRICRLIILTLLILTDSSLSLLLGYEVTMKMYAFKNSKTLHWYLDTSIYATSHKSLPYCYTSFVKYYSPCINLFLALSYSFTYN